MITIISLQMSIQNHPAFFRTTPKEVMVIPALSMDTRQLAYSCAPLYSYSAFLRSRRLWWLMVYLLRALISPQSCFFFMSSSFFCASDQSCILLASSLQQANFSSFKFSFLSTCVYFILNSDTQFLVLYLFVFRYSSTMGLYLIGRVYLFFIFSKPFVLMGFRVVCVGMDCDYSDWFSGFFGFFARMLPVPRSSVHFQQQYFLLLIYTPVNILEKVVSSCSLSLLSNLALDLGKAQKKEQNTD